MSTPANNPENSFLGTAEFSFSEGATTVTQARALGFRDFGNLKAFSLDPKGDDKPHKGSYRGVVRVDKRKRVGLELAYKLTADEYHSLSLALLWMGRNETGRVGQPGYAAAPGMPIPFSATNPGLPERWYDLISPGNTRVRDITSVTFSALAEGADFELDRKLGRVRFFAAQTAALTPTLTGAAIDPAGPKGFGVITPMQAGARSGMGRLVIYQESDRNNIFLTHDDFTCDLTVDGSPDLKSDDWSDYSINVAITRLPGAVFHSND